MKDDRHKDAIPEAVLTQVYGHAGIRLVNRSRTRSSTEGAEYQKSSAFVRVFGGDLSAAAGSSKQATVNKSAARSGSKRRYIYER